LELGENKIGLQLPNLNKWKTAWPNFTKSYGPGSVLHWQRFDTLCNSGFVDGVMFSHSSHMARRVFLSGDIIRQAAETRLQPIFSEREKSEHTTIWIASERYATQATRK